MSSNTRKSSFVSNLTNLNTAKNNDSKINTHDQNSKHIDIFRKKKKKKFYIAAIFILVVFVILVIVSIVVTGKL